MWVAAGAWAGAQSGGQDDSAAMVRPLVGSTIPQVISLLGRPYSVVPLRETGGKLMFFENSRGDRFIIETDVSNHVIDAAVKHPEAR